MTEKLAKIKGVGYKQGHVIFTVAVWDDLETFQAHEIDIIIKDEELTLEKIIEVAKRKELERISDPENKRRVEIAEKFLGKDFKIEIEKEEAS